MEKEENTYTIDCIVYVYESIGVEACNNGFKRSGLLEMPIYIYSKYPLALHYVVGSHRKPSLLSN